MTNPSMRKKIKEITTHDTGEGIIEDLNEWQIDRILALFSEIVPKKKEEPKKDMNYETEIKKILTEHEGDYCLTCVPALLALLEKAREEGYKKGQRDVYDAMEAVDKAMSSKLTKTK